MMMMRVKIQQLALQLVAMAKLRSSPDQVFLRWVEFKQNHLANLNQYNQKIPTNHCAAPRL